MIILSLILSVFAYFDLYRSIYGYLGDLFGYSFATNLFMLLVFSDKKYCFTVKVSVYGLLFLNLFNLLYKIVEIDGFVYDIYVCVLVILISIIYKNK